MERIQTICSWAGLWHGCYIAVIVTRNDPFILGLIQNGKYSQQKLNESRIIHFTTEDDFAALFSCGEISVNIQI